MGCDRNEATVARSAITTLPTIHGHMSSHHTSTVCVVGRHAYSSPLIIRNPPKGPRDWIPPESFQSSHRWSRRICRSRSQSCIMHAPRKMFRNPPFFHLRRIGDLTISTARRQYMPVYVKGEGEGKEEGKRKKEEEGRRSIIKSSHDPGKADPRRIIVAAP